MVENEPAQAGFSNITKYSEFFLKITFKSSKIEKNTFGENL